MQGVACHRQMRCALLRLNLVQAWCFSPVLIASLPLTLRSTMFSLSAQYLLSSCSVTKDSAPAKHAIARYSESLRSSTNYSARPCDHKPSWPAAPILTVIGLLLLGGSLYASKVSSGYHSMQQHIIWSYCCIRCPNRVKAVGLGRQFQHSSC